MLFSLRKHSDKAVSSGVSMRICPEEEPIKKWFGVNTSWSRGSRKTWVRDLEFTTCAISVSAVINVFSLGTCSFKIAAYDVFTDQTRRSHAPPIWGAEGGLNFQMMLSLFVNVSIFELSISRIARVSRMLVKFVPLSQYTWEGIAVKRLRAMIAESLLKLCASSKCMARVVKHVNNAPQHFSCLLPILTIIGPKYSSPQCEKGRCLYARWPSGRAAILGIQGRSRRNLHTMHLATILHKLFRNPVTQYFWRISFTTVSCPIW